MNCHSSPERSEGEESDTHLLTKFRYYSILSLPIGAGAKQKMRIIAGILVIALGIVSAWFYTFLIGSGLGGFFPFALFLLFILVIPSIICSVFIFKAKYWVASLVMSVLFGGVIPVIFIILSRKDWGKDISLKHAVSILLAVLNITAFVILASIYYVIFIVQWGHSAEAIKWGLPVAVISLLALSVAIIALIKTNWKWGIAGICLAILAIPYTNILLNSYSYVLLPQQTSTNHILSPEDQIMKQLILSEVSSVNKNDNTYLVVNPDASVEGSLSVGLDQIAKVSDKYGYDFRSLFNRLLENNKDSVRMQINSSIKDGYYIDYDNIFSKDESEYSYDWPSWYVFRPQVSGCMNLSFPAYDPETGYVMVFVKTESGESTWGGYFSIFKYLDGKLILVENLMIYITVSSTY